MGALVVNRGLQCIGERASIMADGAGATALQKQIQVMSVDDSANAFAAGDTALNSGGAVTNEFDAAFDSTPTRTNQTLAHIMTIPTTSSYDTKVVKRVALHNDTSANVTTSSTTLIAGIDGQSVTKTSSFSLQIEVDIAYTSP